MNYLNSGQPWSPDGRNLFNSSEWEGYGAPFNGSGTTASLLNQLLESLGVPRVVMSATSYEDPMPVVRPGEVTEAPVPSPANVVRSPMPEIRLETSSHAPPDSLADDEAAELARENRMEELPPFVRIGGRENSPYWKTMDGATLREIMAIAKAQYPDAEVRVGKTGRPIITMPSGATRLKVRSIGEWGSGPLEREDIGGQEFHLDAPGVTLRDVANGGSQMVEKIIGTVSGMLGGSNFLAKALRANPAAAAAYGAWKGYDLAEQARKDRVRRYSRLP